jgi:hypothetical protein
MHRFTARLCLAMFLLCGATLSLPHSEAAEFTVEKTDRGVTVNLDGKLFTEFLIKSGKKPILWPIIGPTGKPMTRAFPMDEAGAVAKDQRDHPHHRSFWFSHGDVNRADLWTEGDRSGSTEHREFVEVSGGKTAKIVTTNDWLDNNGKKLAEDKRTFTFSADGDSRIIDFEIEVASAVDELKFGDTKEGTFAVRVPDDFRLTAKKGGRIVNSDGIEGKATWGKQAKWVDYQGPIDGQTLGIAILDHPTNFNYPTRWHVRDYGLFAANPFGNREFAEGNGEQTTTLKSDESPLKLRYRVIFHKGDEKQAKIEECFDEFVGKPKLVPVRGQVKIDGEPLKFGTVIFTPEKGRAATGKLDENGNFVLSTFEAGDGVLTGRHRVAINAGEVIAPGRIRWHAPKDNAKAENSNLVVKVEDVGEGGAQFVAFAFSLTWNGGKPYEEHVEEANQATEKK